MSVFECEMWEMWQFHKFFGSPNVQQEIFQFSSMGRSPKRHLNGQKNKNNQQGCNRDFSRLMSARSLNMCIMNSANSGRDKSTVTVGGGRREGLRRKAHLASKQCTYVL